MSSAEEKELLKCVELGIDAEVFLQSAVGRELVHMARCHAEDAVIELKTVDPEDSKKVREIQNRVWQGESFERFIRELIADGHQAAEVLRAPEE